MHPSDGELLLLFDADAMGPEVDAIAAHVESCPECRTRLEGLAREWRELEDLLKRIDDPVPSRPGVADLMASRTPRRNRAFTIRWAAGVALLLFVGGVAALQHSAISGRIGHLFQSPASRVRGTERTPTTRAGVAVLPAGRIEIYLPPGSERTLLSVGLTAAPEVRLESTDVRTRFRVRGNRIDVWPPAGSSGLAIKIPVTLAVLDVWMGSDLVLRKRGRSWSPSVQLRDVGDSVRIPFNP